MMKKCNYISEALSMKLKLLLFLICGLTGGILVIISASKYGPAISTDSVAYIYSAKSLLAGEGFVYFGYQSAFIQWPPLYPSLLALFIALGIEGWSAALYINAVVFSGIIFLTGLWLFKNSRSYGIALLGSIFVLFSIPVFHVSKYVWSEPLFILLILLFIIHIGEYLKNQKTLNFYLAAIFCSLAFLTRYSGAIVVVTGCVVLLLKRNEWFGKIKEIIIFGLISSTPWLLWVMRNYIVSSTLMGARTSSIYTLRQNINLALKTISSWFIPGSVLQKFLSYGIVPALIVAMMILGIALYIVPLLAEGIKKITDLRETFIPVAAPLGIIVFYIPYLVISASSIAFDTIDNRLMAPVFVPLVLTLLYILGLIFNIMDDNNKKRINIYILMGILSILLIYPAVKVIGNIQQSMEEGAGVFSTNRWHNSELINYIKENPLNGTIYSNNPDAIYAISGLTAMYTPKKDSLTLYEYGFEKFKNSLASNSNSYIVWFNGNNPSTIYNIEELGHHFKIEIVKQLADGNIYIIK
jgi:4-amino-4-deoxy-L-arabinose transferase-like glycosyltransferase